MVWIKFINYEYCYRVCIICQGSLEIIECQSVNQNTEKCSEKNLRYVFSLRPRTQQKFINLLLCVPTVSVFSDITTNNSYNFSQIGLNTWSCKIFFIVFSLCRKITYAIRKVSLSKLRNVKNLWFWLRRKSNAGQ